MDNRMFMVIFPDIPELLGYEDQRSPFFLFGTTEEIHDSLHQLGFLDKQIKIIPLVFEPCTTFFRRIVMRKLEVHIIDHILRLTKKLLNLNRKIASNILSASDVLAFESRIHNLKQRILELEQILRRVNDAIQMRENHLSGVGKLLDDKDSGETIKNGVGEFDDF